MKTINLVYSIAKRKTTNNFSLGFIGYIYDDETRSDKAPNYNNRKFTQYGIFTEAEFCEVSSIMKEVAGERLATDAELKAAYKDLRVEPEEYILGHYIPKKVSSGRYELDFIKAILDKINEDIPDIEKIVVSTLHTAISTYLYYKNSDDELDSGIGRAVKEIGGLNLKKVTGSRGINSILAAEAYRGHDFDYSEQSLLYTKATTLPKITGYSPHPLFYNSNLCYFYNKPSDDAENVQYHEYVLSKFSKKDKFVEDGKPMMGYGVSILRLKNPEDGLEKVIAHHRDCITEKRLGMNAIGNLNGIMDKKFLDLFMSSEVSPLHSTRINDMNPTITYRSDGSIIAEDSFRIIRKYDAEKAQGLIRDILDNFQSGEDKGIKRYDITDLIYTKDDKKATIDKSLNGSKSLQLPKELTKQFTRRKLCLRMGYDIPIYRCLSKLTSLDTQVFLVLYDETKTSTSTNFERYCTIVKSDGDVSIWSTVYSNNLFSFLL